MIGVLAPFAPLFSRRVFEHVQVLIAGTILAPAETTAEESASVEAATPLGRWGGEQEIVKAVAFLIESDFVTGETIRVDGGRHIK